MRPFGVVALQIWFPCFGRGNWWKIYQVLLDTESRQAWANSKMADTHWICRVDWTLLLSKSLKTWKRGFWSFADMFVAELFSVATKQKPRKSLSLEVGVLLHPEKLMSDKTGSFPLLQSFQWKGKAFKSHYSLFIPSLCAEPTCHSSFPRVAHPQTHHRPGEHRIFPSRAADSSLLRPLWSNSGFTFCWVETQESIEAGNGSLLWKSNTLNWNEPVWGE